MKVSSLCESCGLQRSGLNPTGECDFCYQKTVESLREDDAEEWDLE